MAAAIFLIVIGGALGYAAWSFLRLDVTMPTAVAAGAMGALVFGTFIKLLAGLILSLLFAALGAALFLWLADGFQRRRRRRR